METNDDALGRTHKHARWDVDTKIHTTKLHARGHAIDYRTNHTAHGTHDDTRRHGVMRRHNSMMMILTNDRKTNLWNDPFNTSCDVGNDLDDIRYYFLDVGNNLNDVTWQKTNDLRFDVTWQKTR